MQVVVLLMFSKNSNYVYLGSERLQYLGFWIVTTEGHNDTTTEGHI